MTVSNSALHMWADYLESIGENADTTSRQFSAWYFGDGEELAANLAALVMAGTKQATAGAQVMYEHEDEALPRVGDYSVVTDFSGHALCVIVTTSVEIVPYAEVTPEFAATEGEGDGSLEYWRRVHWDFFTRELTSIGIEADEMMPVVCEVFELVYQ